VMKLAGSISGINCAVFILFYFKSLFASWHLLLVAKALPFLVIQKKNSEKNIILRMLSESVYIHYKSQWCLSSLMLIFDLCFLHSGVYL